MASSLFSIYLALSHSLSLYLALSLSLSLFCLTLTHSFSHSYYCVAKIRRFFPSIPALFSAFYHIDVSSRGWRAIKLIQQKIETFPGSKIDERRKKSFQCNKSIRKIEKHDTQYSVLNEKYTNHFKLRNPYIILPKFDQIDCFDQKRRFHNDSNGHHWLYYSTNRWTYIILSGLIFNLVIRWALSFTPFRLLVSEFYLQANYCEEMFDWEISA